MAKEQSFKWAGNVKEFKTWAKSLGVDPKDHFQFEYNILKIRTSENLYYEARKGSIIIKEENGEFVPYPNEAYFFGKLKK